MSVGIEINVLDDLVKFFDDLPDVAEQAAVLAINQVTEREGMTAIRNEMRSQVDFPKGYLESGRLKVRRKAYKGNLEAIIRGRDRATSLARFARGQTPENTRGRGVRVQVKPGQTKTLKRAFLVRLRNGNIGLAVRLKDGELPINTHSEVMLADNVWLLYGPSVDQVLSGVADDVAPGILRSLSKQFLRQFARLTRG